MLSVTIMPFILWPGLPEAGAMILARPNDILTPPQDAELLAGSCVLVSPALLTICCEKQPPRRAVARFKVCQRLSAEADAIPVATS